MNSALTGVESCIGAENLLLAALPEADYRRLRPQMEFVRLPSGSDLIEAGEPVTHVFFPVAGTVALRAPLESGTSTAIALLGNEDLVGISVILEGRIGRGPLYGAVVQNAGYAYRMRADRLLQEFERRGEWRHLLLRAAQAQITQIAQITACNRFHTLPERLCSWLLHSIDCSSDDKIYMTQSMLACMLGVRRETVTEAERHLQCAGAIEYKRGRIHVLDRRALEQRACECYADVKRECARLSLADAVRKPPAEAEPRRRQWERRMEA